MATDFDPYRILSVERGVTMDEVWDAYERLIAEHEVGSSRRSEIEAAYAVIGRPEQRQEYDARLLSRETTGVAAPSRDAVGAVAPGSATTVPWTMGDVAKALILPLLLLILSVGTLIAGGAADEEDLTESEYIFTFAFSFVVQLAYFGLAYHFVVRKYKLSLRALGFAWPPGLRWWFPIVVLGGALITIYAYLLVLVVLGVEPASNIPDNVYDYAIPVVMLGFLSILVAPFVEEVFFRAFLYQGIAKRYGMWAGIIGSGLIFGLAHVGTLDTLIVIPGIAAIGGIFAWSYARTGSIYPSMIAHVIFNTISFAIGFTN
ncbi:MAG: CPBP family glutamic-type intramembrane protease [Dehalococcoidia bacterium]